MKISEVSKKQLEVIKNADVLKLSFQGMIGLILDCWNTDYGKIDFDEKSLTLITGGWSDNEEIISVLQNTLFWTFYWQQSERGGKYIFQELGKT